MTTSNSAKIVENVAHRFTLLLVALARIVRAKNIENYISEKYEWITRAISLLFDERVSAIASITDPLRMCSIDAASATRSSLRFPFRHLTSSFSGTSVPEVIPCYRYIYGLAHDGTMPGLYARNVAFSPSQRPLEIRTSYAPSDGSAR